MENTKNKIMEENRRRLKRVKSPFKNYNEYCNWDTTVAKEMEQNDQIKNFNLDHLVPKVTNYDWSVCYYSDNGKFYRVDSKTVQEVEVTTIVNSNNLGEYPKAVSPLKTKEDFKTYVPNICYGESDDLSCCVWFNLPKKEMEKASV